MNVKKYKLQIRVLLGLLGALGGYLYWRFIGCQAGTCPIQSVWYYSVLWGAALVYLVGDMILDLLIRRSKKNDESICPGD